MALFGEKRFVKKAPHKSTAVQRYPHCQPSGRFMQGMGFYIRDDWV